VFRVLGLGVRVLCLGFRDRETERVGVCVAERESEGGRGRERVSGYRV
jgi:hypothetical protein